MAARGPTTAPCAPAPALTIAISRAGGNIALMHDSVSAIRAGRSRARFVMPPQQRRERHLGLHRLFRTPTERSPQAVTAARRAPLKALREATRGLAVTGGVGPADPGRAQQRALTVGTERPMRWATQSPTGRRTAVPWRG